MSIDALFLRDGFTLLRDEHVVSNCPEYTHQNLIGVDRTTMRKVVATFDRKL